MSKYIYEHLIMVKMTERLTCRATLRCLLYLLPNRRVPSYELVHHLDKQAWWEAYRDQHHPPLNLHHRIYLSRRIRRRRLPLHPRPPLVTMLKVFRIYVIYWTIL